MRGEECRLKNRFCGLVGTKESSHTPYFPHCTAVFHNVNLQLLYCALSQDEGTAEQQREERFSSRATLKEVKHRFSSTQQKDAL